MLPRILTLPVLFVSLFASQDQILARYLQLQLVSQFILSKPFPCQSSV